MLTKLSSWIKLATIVLLLVVPVVFLRRRKKVLITPEPDLASLPTVLPTITVSPTASPTAILTLSPIASVTATPTPTIIPENPYSSEEIHGFFKEYSEKYGLDVNYLRHVAVCESGFDALAINLVYAGLFQFDTRTWETFRDLTNEDPDPDLRFDAREAVKTASYLISIGKTALWPNCIP